MKRHDKVILQYDKTRPVRGRNGQKLPGNTEMGGLAQPAVLYRASTDVIWERPLIDLGHFLEIKEWLNDWIEERKYSFPFENSQRDGKKDSVSMENILNIVFF